MRYLAWGLAGLMATQVAAEENDKFMWLEEVEGEKQLAWVEDRNRESLGILEDLPTFNDLFEKNLEVYNSSERIAYPTIRGNYVYNFWKDENHERGIWRRTTLDEYRKSEPEWETLLDVDAIAKAEDENWVYKGASCLWPDYNRCHISLSRGGADATVSREFDIPSKSFVENGFFLPEAKGGLSWIDKDTVFVGTDFGEGSMTDSGYPRLSKLWKRGTPLEEATLIFEGKSEDVGNYSFVINTPEGDYPFHVQADTFFTRNYFLYKDDELHPLDLPNDAQIFGVFKKQLLVSMKSDWTPADTTFAQGALISIDVDKLLEGSKDFAVVVTPDSRSSIEGAATTKDMLLLNITRDVRSKLYSYTLQDGKWARTEIDAPAFGNLSVSSSSSDNNLFFFTYTDYLTPTTLYVAEGTNKPEALKSLPAFFDASPYVVSQHFATSKDGTKVPYFMVARKDQKLDGRNPTLLYGYGGFEVSMTPGYSATVGMDWLSQGGTYAVANIRGGGEYGPAWHQAALKENRQLAYDDFIAVAEDLVARRVTSPKHLGIRGGSNGGLLMGVMMTQRPDLFNAIVCQVPLLDMKRYNKLLAGASWMAEYGNPDIPEEWAYISEYSPYQNLDPEKEYPQVFFTTSTRDDRVHPGHARKMVAKLIDQGKPVYYYENTEGGHAGAANNRQSARVNALIYSYLLDQLKGE